MKTVVTAPRQLIVSLYLFLLKRYGSTKHCLIMKSSVRKNYDKKLVLLQRIIPTTRGIAIPSPQFFHESRFFTRRFCNHLFSVGNSIYQYPKSSSICAALITMSMQRVLNRFSVTAFSFPSGVKISQSNKSRHIMLPFFSLKVLIYSSVFKLHTVLSSPYFKPITNIAPDTAPQTSAHLTPLFKPQETLKARDLSIPYFPQKAPKTACEQYNPLLYISDAIFTRSFIFKSLFQFLIIVFNAFISSWSVSKSKHEMTITALRIYP